MIPILSHHSGLSKASLEALIDVARDNTFSSLKTIIRWLPITNVDKIMSHQHHHNDPRSDTRILTPRGLIVQHRISGPKVHSNNCSAMTVTNLAPTWEKLIWWSERELWTNSAKKKFAGNCEKLQNKGIFGKVMIRICRVRNFAVQY